MPVSPPQAAWPIPDDYQDAIKVVFVPSTTRKIAIVTETFPPEINGVANTLNYLCQGLMACGHQVQVIRPRQVNEGKPGHQPLEGDALEQHVVAGVPLPGYPELRLGLPCGRRLSRLWKRQQPDAIYVATEGPLGWSAVRAAKRLGIPVSSGFHTNFHTYSQYYGAGFLESIIAVYLRAFHNRTDNTLVPTQRMRQRLEAMGIERVQVMSRGVDCDRFTPERRDPETRARWGLREDELVVQYVGRLAPEKNLTLAVHSFERLRAFHPNVRFMLVGDGPLRRKLQERHPDYVFCGMQEGDELARHYAAGDIFLFPSKTDTFGNVVLEAMASGLAVVGFDDAASAEHIQHEFNGMKADLHDDEAFICSVMKLADQPSLLQQVRTQARETALSLHWRLVTETFQRTLLDERPRVYSPAAKASPPKTRKTTQRFQSAPTPRR